MPDFRKLYFMMFAAAADAVEDLECGNVADARRRLIDAQRRAEEEYIERAEAEISCE